MSRLLYDADCGFCTKAAILLGSLGLRTEIMSLQGQIARTPALDVERAFREIPFVRSDGSIEYGHRAIAAALETGPRPVRWAGRLLVAPVLRRPAAAVYRWVADHRHSLPGGTSRCALPADTSRGANAPDNRSPATPDPR